MQAKNMQITRVCKTFPVIICDLTGHFRWTGPSAPLSASMTNSISRSKTMIRWSSVGPEIWETKQRCTEERSEEF
jgi:hypothetical protein